MTFKPAPLTRSEVFDVIEAERVYQDTRWNPSTTTTGGRHTVAEYVLYMEHYITEARRLLSTQSDPKGAQDGLDMVRKIAALASVCMEQNGAVTR